MTWYSKVSEKIPFARRNGVWRSPGTWLGIFQEFLNYPAKGAEFLIDPRVDYLDIKC